MRDLVSHELRRVHRKIAQAERRMALVDMTGKVKAGSQDMDKRTVRLVLGKSENGQEILSAPVRWDAPGTGDFQMHAVPKDGEQMKLHSPSGTIGPSSLARWGTYDKDNKPPSNSKDEAVLSFRGKGRITWTDDSIAVTNGEGSGFKVTPDKLQMLGKFVAKNGSRPAHYKGGKDSDGDIAVDGNENVLI